ncbi:hypothetical protein PPACK8108_LOCUS14131 [Phakopsora pachyrhizi]|uniref:Uncharacterized protein n=1 Tax=Phakopsora pachyrhizi TaxID=170000 RepID=A0AAV0B6P4_PHAPC|nr:hypothetical protein PPACK8108_LOCUS14131 [Phakopsora pachyrhizi]
MSLSRAGRAGWGSASHPILLQPARVRLDLACWAGSWAGKARLGLGLAWMGWAGQARAGNGRLGLGLAGSWTGWGLAGQVEGRQGRYVGQVGQARAAYLSLLGGMICGQKISMGSVSEGCSCVGGGATDEHSVGGGEEVINEEAKAEGSLIDLQAQPAAKSEHIHPSESDS